MKIVFFDGYCSLCNSLVDRLMRMDQTGELKFASLQGKTALRLLGKSAEGRDPDTVVYLRDGKRFERSSAILHALADTGGLWKAVFVFFLVPGFLRDFVYRIFAKNRFRLFGRRDSCRMPASGERERLLP